jgi:oligoribonuclease NrnB/cAMP/cGMP phosphodiesterase (DHH superfamily)
LLSHKPDIDGVTPVILSKLTFEEVDYLLVETFETNPTIIQFIENGFFEKYDYIYITDLSVDKNVCEMISNNSILREKIKIFDHHKSHLFVNDYEFGTAVDIDVNGNKQSGTSLFYKYLLSNYKSNYIISKGVAEFVELVRQYDTWEWFNKYNNENAKRLTDLFEIFGYSYFIEYYYNHLKECNNFCFTDKELYLLEIEQARIDRYVVEKSQTIIPVKLLNYNAGLVFSENYRSELGNRLANMHKEQYDFIILVNLSRGVSYRGIKNINLGEIAGIFGGKGHVNSSSSPLPQNLKNEIIEKIFKDKVSIKSFPNSNIYDRINN